MPVFEKIETIMVKKLKFRPTLTLRFIVRNVYVGKCALLPLSNEFRLDVSIDSITNCVTLPFLHDNSSLFFSFILVF